MPASITNQRGRGSGPPALAFRLRPLRRKSDLLFPIALILSALLHFGGFSLILLNRGSSPGPVHTGPMMVKLADLPSGRGGRTGGKVKQEKKPKAQKDDRSAQKSKTSLPGKVEKHETQASGLGHKGNAGLGGENTGVILDEAAFRYEWYKARLEDLLKSHWQKPILNNKKVVSASVHFTITSAGDAVGVQIVSSSGSSAFDQSVIRAVYDSSPFPRFPPQYKSPSLGVMYTFELLPED